MSGGQEPKSLFTDDPRRHGGGGQRDRCNHAVEPVVGLADRHRECQREIVNDDAAPIVDRTLTGPAGSAAAVRFAIDLAGLTGSERRISSSSEAAATIRADRDDGIPGILIFTCQRHKSKT